MFDEDLEMDALGSERKGMTEDSAKDIPEVDQPGKRMDRAASDTKRCSRRWEATSRTTPSQGLSQRFGQKQLRRPLSLRGWVSERSVT